METLSIIMVLHTWGQNLGQHVHAHCIVTDGGLSPDRERWLTPRHKGFLFPVRALSKVLRGKYLDLLAAARDRGELVDGCAKGGISAVRRAFAGIVFFPVERLS